MTVQRISAVTFAVRNMARSVVFYRDQVGLTLLYGGETAEFTSFQVGDNYLNIMLNAAEISWWGRTIFYVDDVDALHRKLVNLGLSTDTAPQDASWGERYFHITDPDGHELSFARRLEPTPPLNPPAERPVV